MNKIRVMVIRPKGQKNKKIAYYKLTFLKGEDASHIKDMTTDAQIKKFEKQIAKDLKIPDAWTASLFYDTEDLEATTFGLLERVLKKADGDMRMQMNYDSDVTSIFEIMVTFYNGGSRQSSALDFQYIGPPKNRKPPKKYYKFDFTGAHGTKHDGKVVYMVVEDYEKEMKKYHSHMMEIVGTYKGFVEASRKSHKNFYDEMYMKHSVIRAISDWAGGAKFPDFSIWDAPTGYIKAAERYVKMDSYDLAMTSYDLAAMQIKLFEDSYNTAEQQWRGYREGTEKGAGRAVLALQVTREASFMALKMMLAPQVVTAAGGGYIVSTLVEMGVGTTIEAVKEGVSQAAEVNAGVTQKFDWKAFGKKMAIEGVASFAGGLVSKYKGIWVSRLYNEIGKDVAKGSARKLTEMEIKEYIEKTIVSKGFGEGWAAGKAVEAAVKKLEGKSGSNMDDFIGLLIKDIKDQVGLDQFMKKIVNEINADLGNAGGA